MCCNKRRNYGTYGGCGRYQQRKPLVMLAAQAAYPHVRSLVDKARSKYFDSGAGAVNKLPSAQPLTRELPSGGAGNNPTVMDEKRDAISTTISPFEDLTGAPPSYDRAVNGKDLVSENSSSTAGIQTPTSSVARSRASSVATTSFGDHGYINGPPSSLPSPRASTAIVRVQITGRGLARSLRALDASEDDVALVRIPVAADVPYDTFVTVLAAEIAAHVRMLGARATKREGKVAKVLDRIEGMGIGEVRVRWRGRRDELGSSSARDNADSETMVLDEFSRDKVFEMMAQRNWTDSLVVRLEEED